MFKIIPIGGGVCASDGFYADGVSAGLRPNGAADVAFIYSDTLCDAASLFTTNKMTAAPIRHFRSLGDIQTNFVLVNAKNANAMTGNAGVEDINELLGILNVKFNKAVNPVMSSTGVIGQRLPKEKIAAAFDKFDLCAKNGSEAAKAIMTTDRWPKEIAFRVELEDGRVFHIGAMAKGAGMIDPAMATMLCFITTDADAPKSELQELLRECNESTFNAITVDGDTSTNDTVLLLANKKSGAYERLAFKEALRMVMHNLAVSMAKDGEGATKLVAFYVTNAASILEARTAAKALANSMLVKTMLFGEDPNWGRVAGIVGASGVQCSESEITISFNDITLFKKGEILMDKELEAKAHEVMKKDEFRITADLGMGDASFTAYGCDLGHEYVKINADYRT